MCPVLLSSGRVQPSTLSAPSALLRTVVTVGGRTWLALGRSPLYHSAYNWDPRPTPHPPSHALWRCMLNHHHTVFPVITLTSAELVFYLPGLLWFSSWAYYWECGGQWGLAVCFVRSQIFPSASPSVFKIKLKHAPTRSWFKYIFKKFIELILYSVQLLLQKLFNILNSLQSAKAWLKVKLLCLWNSVMIPTTYVMVGFMQKIT